MEAGSHRTEIGSHMTNKVSTQKAHTRLPQLACAAHFVPETCSSVGGREFGKMHLMVWGFSREACYVFASTYLIFLIISKEQH